MLRYPSLLSRVVVHPEHLSRLQLGNLSRLLTGRSRLTTTANTSSEQDQAKDGEPAKDKVETEEQIAEKDRLIAEKDGLLKEMEVGKSYADVPSVFVTVSSACVAL